VEARGIPAVVLGTDAFVSLARAQAAKHGRPHLAVALVPHPVGGIDPSIVRRKAAAVVDEVVIALTRDPAPPPRPAPSAAAPLVEAPDDLDAFQDWAMAERWSDGLPVLLPTAARVERLLGPWQARRHEVIATLAPLDGAATLEAIAVNAALAGAGPEHLPVIVAAVRAIAEPRFNLNAIQTTTHPCTPLLIVNGPVAARVGVSGGPNALGNGHRANAVIGRRTPRLPERRRRPAGTRGPRDARSSGQVRLLPGRERGGVPVAAAARRARLPGLHQLRHGLRLGGAAQRQRPRLHHARGLAHGADRHRCHHRE
jgi:hypothetical protein